MKKNDYYPFGMMMPGRKYSGGSGYRYGFNGKEMDNEVKGEGNSIDFGNRTYDSRLGRFLSVDRLTTNTPFYSPYIFAGNKPIVAIDKNGDIEIIIHVYDKNIDPITKKVTVHLKHTTKLEVTTLEDVRGIYRSPAEVNVYFLNTATERKVGNSTYYDWTSALNSVEDVKNTGLTTMEQLKVDDKANYYGFKAFKIMTKTVGLFQLAEGMEGQDFTTGEKKTIADRWIDIASGLTSLLSMGRAGATSGNFNSWGKKKLIDASVEEGLTMVMERLGMTDKSKQAVLVYHIGRFLLDMKKVKSITDILIKAASLETKVADYLESELKNQLGIDLSQPLDKNQALSITISNYLSQQNTDQDKKVIEKYKKNK